MPTLTQAGQRPVDASISGAAVNMALRSGEQIYAYLLSSALQEEYYRIWP